MKTSLLFALTLGTLAFAATAQAGPRMSVFVNAGGGAYCGPRYAAPVYYAPRRAYCPPPVVAYRVAPIYCAPARVVYVAPRRAYRAPVLNAGVTVAPRFGWRR